VAEKLSQTRLIFLKESVAFVATVSVESAKLIPDGVVPGWDKLGQTPLRVRKHPAQALLPVQIESQSHTGKDDERSRTRREEGGRRPRKIPRAQRGERTPLEAGGEGFETREIGKNGLFFTIKAEQLHENKRH
jgi:hypothetical protein